MVPGEIVDLPDLPTEVRDEELQLKSAIDLLPVKLDLAATLDKLEAALIRRAMVKAEFVQVKAADLLGLSKSLLQYKLNKYNIGH
jgi:two-component system NtrC family response regulator